MNFGIVLSTTDSIELARKVAHALVERRLAACVNIVPRVESVYRWQDKIETAQEFLLIIKTSGERYQGVRDALRELHTYELPECIEIKIDNGSEPYLQWIASCVSSETL